MQDPRTVEKLRRGDVATLKRLFKSNHAKLYPMAYRLTRSRDAAGATIRKVFSRLWEDREELDVFEPLDVGLVQRTYAEAMAYRAEHAVDGFEMTSHRVPEGSEIATELDKIPAQDLLGYLLFTVDGYTFRELAVSFGVSIDDVKLSIGRAMVTLKGVS